MWTLRKRKPSHRAQTDAVPGKFTEHHYHKRMYKVYVPSGYEPGAPVPMLVMLHGCRQNPDDFAIGTGMNQYAERYTCIVVYPQQPRKYNSQRCWNWFKTENQMRGQGEPAAIMDIVEQVRSEYAIDPDRIYAAGLSAGGAMAVILGATYPDVFTAIGVSGGVEYQAAANFFKALIAMKWRGPGPIKCGNAAYLAMGEHWRVVPVIVVHGTSDGRVRRTNADQVIAQWARTNQLASNETKRPYIEPVPTRIIKRSMPEGRQYTEYIYRNDDGTQMKKFLVEGMKHRWSGGSASGSYTDPLGPDASRLMAEFFMAHPRGGIPVEVVVDPQPGETVEEVPVPAPPEKRPGLLQRIGQALGIGRRSSEDKARVRDKAAPTAEEAPPATSAEEEPPATSAEEEAPAPTAEEAPPATSQEEESPAHTAEEAPPATSAEEEPPARSAEEEPPATSAEEEPPARSAEESDRPGEKDK